jgi:hypothetical protein
VGVGMPPGDQHTPATIHQDTCRDMDLSFHRQERYSALILT